MTISITRRALTAGVLAGSVAFALPAAGASASPETKTRQGRVRGFVRNGASIFLGMPYGADTCGPRRFLPPAPPASWSGVRDATRPGQRSPQSVSSPPRGFGLDYFAGNRGEEILALKEPMGEDCLVVNVVTPAVDKRRRPVLFYIHGGGFTTGSGLLMTLGDEFAVREDVVLVTVNHRLGHLGNAYLGGISPEFARGNPGMLDLVAALGWVRDNIAHFGGDPEKVTIFGESGGGAKIGFLLAMPEAKGLFRGAIIQSGLLPTPTAPADATAAARQLMTSVGAASIGDLQALPYQKLIPAGMEGIFPVADGHAFASDPWRQAPEMAADVPLIIGYCKDELTLFSLAQPKLFQLDWSEVAGSLTSAVSLPIDKADSVISAYRAAFPSDSPSDLYFRISSDASFGRAMFTMADRKCAQRPPVYFYRMAMDTKEAPGLRAIHTAELPMTVGLVPRPEAAPLARQISGAWAAFARSGNPNHAGLPEWPRYDPSNRKLMTFDIVSTAGDDPDAGPRNILYSALSGVRQWNPIAHNGTSSG